MLGLGLLKLNKRNDTNLAYLDICTSFISSQDVAVCFFGESSLALCLRTLCVFALLMWAREEL
jgi:hypothetical protein